MEREGRQVVFHDVKSDPAALAEMLRLSQGVRKVPVLVEGDKVTIGFGGT